MKRRFISLVVLLAAGTTLAQPGSIPVSREPISGLIAGRVCRDLDADERCGDDEPGIARVRLILETGQQVWTDARGRYHLAAVEARVPDAEPFVHLRPGRHRLAVDLRTLPPGGRLATDRVLLEVPMAGLVLQDFAVRDGGETLEEVGSAWKAHPPTGTIGSDGGVQFTVTGRVSPGDRVEVDDASADVDEEGLFRRAVSLREGDNRVSIRVQAPSGVVRLLEQRIFVVRRDAGVLVIPRGITPTATLLLPGGDETPANAGPSRIRVEAPEGTSVTHPGGRFVVDASGAVDVPVLLTPGTNVVRLRLENRELPAREVKVEIPARSRPFGVGLLHAEAVFRPGRGDLFDTARVFGGGTGYLEAPLGKWLLEAQLDLRDDDLRALEASPSATFLAPRSLLDLQRALDPERVAGQGLDDSVSIHSNPEGARVRVEARHPDYGGLGLGTYRAWFGDSEIGRYHRLLFGGHASLGTDSEEARGVRVEAFGSSGDADPLTSLTTTPTHAEFLATGGSLFYLPHPAIARGSEVVRVVVRDALTRIPMSERHLVRGVDYDVDYLSGRILLAEPLSMIAPVRLLRSDPPTAGAEPVLVVDYERLLLGAPERGAAGGRVKGWWGPFELSVGGAGEGPEQTRYGLLRATASAKFGRLLFTAEGARSEGAAHRAGNVTLSESGGLDAVFADPTGDEAEGWAWGLRLRGHTFGEGTVDASWRRRTPGYSDASWDGLGAMTQASARIEQPVQAFRVGVLADSRTATDPRAPFGDDPFSARTLAGYVGYEQDRWSARLEVKDQSLTVELGLPDAEEGARTAVGLVGRYRLHERVWLQAAHQQVVATRGEGLGATDTTFSSAGVEVSLDPRTRGSLQGGWGPELGPQVWADVQVARGPDVWYGGYSVDLEGPDFGERRAVTGARTSIDEGTHVFVEDVGAHDANAVRIARGVGFSRALGPGFELTARYERGVSQPFLVPSPFLRDAGSVGAVWFRERLRLSARAEVRSERGERPLSAGEPVDRLQRLVSAAATWDVLHNLRVSGRLLASDTLGDVTERARLVEGSAGLSWRLDPLLVVLHYGVERELSPARPESGDRLFQVASLRPALRLGDRFAIASGLHAAWSSAAGTRTTVLSLSLRPSVRVYAGLELAAEVARRSTAPDEGELNAVRGEVAYRFDESLRMAAGYTFLGYSGLGLRPQDDGDEDRLYLRAEAAW